MLTPPFAASPCSRNCRRSSKFSYEAVLQRKSFPPPTTPSRLPPIMAPASARQTSRLPSQPARLLPSKSETKPGSLARIFATCSAARRRVATRASWSVPATASCNWVRAATAVCSPPNATASAIGSTSVAIVCGLALPYMAIAAINPRGAGYLRSTSATRRCSWGRRAAAAAATARSRRRF